MKALSVLLMVLAGPSLFSQEKVFTLASAEFPPLAGSSLEGQGVLPALVRKIMEPLGYRVEVSFVPFPRLLDEIKFGQVDAGGPRAWKRS